MRSLRGKGNIPLILTIAGCWLLAHQTGIAGIERHQSYGYATSLLLCVGLYSSTYGIDLKCLSQDRRRVLTAVTVGVLFKAALIGAVLLLVTGDWLSIILGVAVAQVDPLAVASIMGNDRLSPRAKAILASWASFDDPVTVILAVYASALTSGAIRTGVAGGMAGAVSGEALGYGVTVLANLGFVVAAYLGWRWLARVRLVRMVFLLALAVVAVVWSLALGVAIAGLVVRPEGLSRFLAESSRWALLIAAGLLGALLAQGIDISLGIVLGMAAFGAHMVAAVPLTRGLPGPDRLHLAFAQQNGITAIILALSLETQHPGVAAVVGPAILVTNVIHYLANHAIDRRRP